MKKWLIKIEQIWLFLFLLFIPTQLGRHFWPEWSYILGLRIDYLSPTFYLLDLIWIGLFLVKSLSSYKVYKVKKYLNFKSLLLVLFVGVNILVAENQWAAGYKWIRIAQLIWTIGYLRIRRKELKNYLKLIIPIWIIIESFLGWAQVVNSGSLNGWWYLLGERSFNFNTIGIAQISWWGEGFVRAYGTFSHPNSLSGFLLVGMILWWRYKSLGKNIFQKTLWWVVTWSGILGIIVTGSRLIWLLLILIIFYKVFRTINLGWSLIVLGLMLILIGVLGNKNVLGGWDKESFNKRVELNSMAINMVKKDPFLGVGMGNFLVELPKYQPNSGLRWLQPVHNIPLLLISEVGLMGILIFNFQFSIFKKIKNLIKSKNNIVILIWGVILVTGFFDHYWLTLPQNWWIMGIVLSMTKFRKI